MNLVVPCAFLMTKTLVQGVAAASALVRDGSFTLPDIEKRKRSAQTHKNHSAVDTPIIGIN